MSGSDPGSGSGSGFGPGVGRGAGVDNVSRKSVNKVVMVVHLRRRSLSDDAAAFFRNTSSDFFLRSRTLGGFRFGTVFLIALAVRVVSVACSRFSF